MRKILLLALFFSALAGYAQDVKPEHVCSTTDVHVLPVHALSMLKATGREYHIPVVFHVFDPYNPQSKLSLDKAQKVIKLLNENFAAKNPLISQVQDVFKPLIQDSKIVFHLAQKDPYGNATNGITYHTRDIKGDNPGCNATLKRQANWNMGGDYSGIQRYLQIWVTYNVNSSNNGTGWSYLPDTDGGGKMAGIVYNHKYLYGTSSDNVLAHEVGHYLGLSHTFGSSYDYCGDDGIDDTPETRCYTWECRKGNLCNDGLVNTENFMDYSGCTSMFTKGQIQYMHYWLEHEYRSNLWSEDNQKFTGIYEEVTVGINDELNTRIRVYPNPSKGVINITGLPGFKAELYDVLGKRVAHSHNQPVYFHVPGMYFLKIIVGEKSVTKKVMIQ
ncbi:zinc-dependent metalloprotease [Carboxylicivirga sediminis]|uniref:Zinc-dependent metalloprotease n=1 Tax=Carboxylicivirga sediminis TaxID=2006564 RepID=A0A941IZ13_9BACT|nr:zinc-dependent metalloprotease [Carboxylicivirga sediminis]MBR8536352.1 zinc-dependent metalloprotease [Carboxylicivirga sediminis]